MAPSFIQVFDPKQDFSVVERKLPHWSQAGTISFITWRTWDSIPARVLQNWLSERNAWLRSHGVDPFLPDWQRELEPLMLQEFQLFVSDRWNEHLDCCYGECVLKRKEIANEVAASLRHFDGDRYELTDFVIMPNHVHLLVVFPSEDAMLKQCESWKHFTAAKINRVLGRKGRFWQQDGFDHLVRSQTQFDFLRKYIAENPIRAKLRSNEYLHESKQI